MKTEKKHVKVAVVVPTIRQESINRFIKEWNINENSEFTLFVIEDKLSKSIKLPDYIKHFSHEEMKLMEASFPYNELISVGSAANVIFGFWLAYYQDFDYILKLDDDCYPANGKFMDELIESHLEVLGECRNNTFFQTLNSDYSRGVPYAYRVPSEVVLSVGSWNNIPDIDGITQLNYVNQDKFCWPKGKTSVDIIPKNVPFTLCGMNVFFPVKMVPFMYFWPTLNKFHRWDDIFLGYVIKQYCDENNLCICLNGNARIWHDRASDPYKNIMREGNCGGYELNLELAQKVLDQTYFWNSPIKSFDDYLRAVKQRYKTWLSLFGVKDEFD